MSLQNKTVSGVFWSFLRKMGASGISFITMIVLARQLTPKDFGLVGMITIFIQISQTLIDSGFNLALIQKKNADEEDYSSVFFINLVVSSVAYLILFVAAPYIATFYNQPQLIKIIRIISLVFIINAFSYVQETRLTKEVKFKTLMIIHIPSNIIGGITGIIMAFNGFGVWSIIGMQLATSLSYAIQIWIHGKWKPLFIFNTAKVKSLFSFGGKLLISRLLGTLYDNILLVIMGKFYPVSSVGFYQNANNLASAPSTTITSVLYSVTFPIFSFIQDDNKLLKQGYKKIMQQIFFWICPSYIIVGILAYPLYQILFSEKWLAAVPYFQWLCITAIFQPLTTYNLNILNVKGRSDIFLKLQTIRRSVSITAIILALPFGIKSLLIVQACSIVFAFLLFSHYAGKLIHYGLAEQIKDLLPTLLLSLAVGLIVLFADYFLRDYSNLTRVITCFSIGMSLFILIARLYKFEGFTDVLLIIKKRIRGKFVV